VLADKDARGIVEALVPVVSGFVVTAPDSPRALPAPDLARVVGEVTGRTPLAIAPLSDAIASALQATRDSGAPGVVVTGSLTTAGQARTLLHDTSATL
jgi:dihydrofolate synthase/folylpolyglutamate synthase